MKRFVKLFFIAIFSLLVFVSCGDTTQQTQTGQGGNEHQHEYTSDDFERDSAVHWKECSSCDELVDMAEHEYTEFVQSETREKTHIFYFDFPWRGQRKREYHSSLFGG